MNRFWTIFLLAVAALMCGCSTPSLHPVYSKDKEVFEPGIIGTWAQTDAKTTYSVTRVGDGYHMLVKNNDPKDPQQWEISLKLVRLGEHMFADFAAVEEERDRHEEHWGALFIATHMFAKVRIEGDSLKVWTLDRDWLKGAAKDGSVKLGLATLSDNEVLITSPTPELQAFLQANAVNNKAFPDPVDLVRQKP